jgi:hypothetical protein
MNSGRIAYGALPAAALCLAFPACSSDTARIGSDIGEGGAQGSQQEGQAGASTGGSMGGDVGVASGGAPAAGGAVAVAGYFSDTPVPVDPGPYGYCAAGETSYYPQCPFSSHGGWGDPELGVCGETCMCNYPCGTDADCPTPSTGTAVAVCSQTYRPGSCQIPCNNGETCPDGMSCLSYHGGENLCVWFTTGEENFSCWVSEDPDGCSQYTTRDACEARISDPDDPRQPMAGCLWITETIYSSTADSCEPASGEEKCVGAIHSSGDLCAAPYSCGGKAPAVYWADLGAGTVALAQVENCHFRPTAEFGAYRYRACEFGEPTIPGMCDCACRTE